VWANFHLDRYLLGHILQTIRTASFAFMAASVFALPSLAQDQTDETARANLLSDPATVLATVDGTEITLGHMMVQLDRLPDRLKQAGNDEQLFNMVLENLINEAALAPQWDPEASPLLTLMLENQTRAMMANGALSESFDRDVTDEALRAKYDEMYGDPAREYNASHILLNTESTARTIKQRLDAGEDFAQLARERSVGPSAPNGGALGWFGLGSVVPEFEAAIVALGVGDVSDPVETQFGWHVIVLNDMRDETVPEFDTVRAELENQILNERVDAILAAARAAVDIERLPVNRIDVSAIRNIDAIE
jgi:peptidyl-prolyl cis-trans isomerase C